MTFLSSACLITAQEDAAKTADKLAKDKGVNIKIIYGMEGYVFDDRDCRLPDGTIDYRKKQTNVKSRP